MSLIENLKLEAIALRMSEKAAGRSMKHCAALEQEAKKHGYENWRAVCAVLAGEKVPALDPEVKHYESAEWNFALDIPKRWNVFPAVPTNSPYEVIRFASHENGTHLLIIFRQPRDPKRALHDYRDEVERSLKANNFGNFVAGKTTIGSTAVPVLNLDRPKGTGTWRCREYFIPAGTILYTLGFGTDQEPNVFDRYDRIAKSFEIIPELPGS